MLFYTFWVSWFDWDLIEFKISKTWSWYVNEITEWKVDLKNYCTRSVEQWRQKSRKNNPESQESIELSVKLKSHYSFISRCMNQTKLKNKGHDIYWLCNLISSSQLSPSAGFLVLFFFCHNLQDVFCIWNSITFFGHFCSISIIFFIFIPFRLQFKSFRMVI